MSLDSSPAGSAGANAYSRGDQAVAPFWLEVAVTTTTSGAEAVAYALEPFLIGPGAAVQEQLGDPNDLSPTALLPAVAVKIYVPAEQDSAAWRAAIELRLTAVSTAMADVAPISAPQFRRLADSDWATAWRDHYHPFRIANRFWVEPSWLAAAPERPSGDIVLRLDPGMAFGTGLHATTQLCLAALVDYCPINGRLLDLGTGSGILAIAAAALGAGEVLALDNDPVAVRAAQENVSANGVVDRVQVAHGELSAGGAGEWDCLMVNILAPIIIDLLASAGLLTYLKADTGRLILSGIIRAQEEAVRAATMAAGGVVTAVHYQDDWLAMVIVRPA